MSRMQSLDRGAEILLYEANNTEKPCARKPHAGLLENGRVTGCPCLQESHAAEELDMLNGLIL